MIALFVFGLLLWLTFSFGLSKPYYVVVKEYHDDGFEIRKSPGSTWVEILDKEKYDKYLSRRATQLWKKYEQRR